MSRPSLKIPSFRVSATVLIGGGEPSQGEELLQGFAIRPGLQNLDNQMLVLSSHSIISRTVDALPFEIDVYRKGFRSQISLFPSSPFRIEPGEEGLPNGIEFTYEYVSGEQYHLSSSKKIEL